MLSQPAVCYLADVRRAEDDIWDCGGPWNVLASAWRPLPPWPRPMPAAPPVGAEADHLQWAGGGCFRTRPVKANCTRCSRGFGCKRQCVRREEGCPVKTHPGRFVWQPEAQRYMCLQCHGRCYERVAGHVRQCLGSLASRVAAPAAGRSRTGAQCARFACERCERGFRLQSSRSLHEKQCPARALRAKLAWTAGSRCYTCLKFGAELLYGARRHALACAGEPPVRRARPAAAPPTLSLIPL